MNKPFLLLTASFLVLETCLIASPSSVLAMQDQDKNINTRGISSKKQDEAKASGEPPAGLSKNQRRKWRRNQKQAARQQAELRQGQAGVGAINKIDETERPDRTGTTVEAVRVGLGEEVQDTRQGARQQAGIEPASELPITPVAIPLDLAKFLGFLNSEETAFESQPSVPYSTTSTHSQSASEYMNTKEFQPFPQSNHPFKFPLTDSGGQSKNSTVPHVGPTTTTTTTTTASSKQPSRHDTALPKDIVNPFKFPIFLTEVDKQKAAQSEEAKAHQEQTDAELARHLAKETSREADVVHEETLAIVSGLSEKEKKEQLEAIKKYETQKADQQKKEKEKEKENETSNKPSSFLQENFDTEGNLADFVRLEGLDLTEEENKEEDILSIIPPEDLEEHLKAEAEIEARKSKPLTAFWKQPASLVTNSEPTQASPASPTPAVKPAPAPAANPIPQGPAIGGAALSKRWL